MDVIMYLRKSRSDDPHESTEETLRRHREQLEALAVKRELHIIKIYNEVVSGESLYARPEMQRLLEDISTGEYDAVLVMDVDRLGRGSMAEQGLIFNSFRDSDTKIVTPEKVIDLQDESDEELLEIQGFIARRELKLIKKRLRRGLAKSLTDGAYASNPPYGYRKAVENKLPTLEIYEPEAKFVRMIFDLYVNGGIGTGAIANQINTLGAKPARSESFNRTTVSYIIKNPVYVGMVRWDFNKYFLKDGKRQTQRTPENIKLYKGIHPPIIDDETFENAQEIITKLWHKKYYDGHVENPLAGLVFCGNCGARMFRHPPCSHSHHDTLLCMKKGCVPSTTLSDVEEAVLSNIKSQLRALDVKVASASPIDLSVFDKNIAAAESELKKVAIQSDKIHYLLEQGVYDIETFLERRKNLSKRVKELNNLIASEKEKREKTLASDITKVSKQIHSVLDVYASGSAEERNNLLRKIIDSIVYYKVERGYNKPFSVVVNLRYF